MHVVSETQHRVERAKMEAKLPPNSVAEKVKTFRVGWHSWRYTIGIEWHIMGQEGDLPNYQSNIRYLRQLIERSSK